MQQFPPCRENLKFHISRADHTSTTYKNAKLLIVSFEEPTHHGWNNELKANWYDVPFPDDDSEILFDADVKIVEISIENSRTQCRNSSDDSDHSDTD